jgi:hypothetical protein
MTQALYAHMNNKKNHCIPEQLTISQQHQKLAENGASYSLFFYMNFKFREQC